MRSGDTKAQTAGGRSFGLRAALAGLAIAALMAHGALADDAAATGNNQDAEIITSHGYSYFGDLKYPADFPHFDYVNPEAPKGGEISLAVTGTFSSMNPYSRKDRAGAYSWMMYESLLGDMPSTSEGLPADVYGQSYGLLAERLEYDAGKNWVIFYMRPEARFSDGTPVTAHDVVFSHNLLLDQGLQSYAEAVRQRVPGAEALDDHTVKFTFAEGISRRSLIDQVGNVPVFSKAWYEETGARLDEPRMDPSPGSGPYVLQNAEADRSITYTRNPEYWGRDLPINLGRHNFDTISVLYFADDAVAFQAFTGGEYSFRAETTSKTWATGYDFPAANEGWVKLEEIPDGSPPVPSGFVFNLGREKLQDKRVREAISLAFNFEWTNESLQFGLFEQRDSFVQDTPLEAMGAPEGAELELLQSLGDVIPEEVLTQPAVTAHTSDASRLTDRRNLRRAMSLLDEAGWPVGEGGMRRNAEGEVLSIELPVSSSGSATIVAVVENFINNLEAMGIDAKMEKIDSSQYTLRNRDRDYDMIFDSYMAFLEPGTGLMQRFGSEGAEYSLFNPAGLASPMVDAIINAALDTNDLATQEAALMALDRALRYERFMIPVWYNDSHWVAYWDKFAHPEPMPPYALGVLDFWWVDPDKAAALAASGEMR
ncbi:microcin C transport system substrate-binding protein [Roseovarius nanhaiticus]|uniref:Microcin C transport system substrate-binding protein n=1 Tax=Roseovarius nanhaiticus TaxID=573024 RepID=A0A1N7H286_9RHOB|nr:extracellular solute-binding protein [Roseovarius nanhaiticus]SEL15810.1 microcin C transport system substrate-binding protein [Roseovarius nanhaiticus]SIS18935.1 microcin C transport system substrate-binding protein [Roseovarius nanhaiticus]